MPEIVSVQNRFSPRQYKLNPVANGLILVAFAVDGETPIVVGAFSPAALARRTLAGTFTPGQGSVPM